MEVEVPLDAIKLPKSVLTKDNHVFVLGKTIKLKNVILKLIKSTVKYL